MNGPRDFLTLGKQVRWKLLTPPDSQGFPCPQDGFRRPFDRKLGEFLKRLDREFSLEISHSSVVPLKVVPTVFVVSCIGYCWRLQASSNPHYPTKTEFGLGLHSLQDRTGNVR